MHVTTYWQAIEHAGQIPTSPSLNLSSLILKGQQTSTKTNRNILNQCLGSTDPLSPLWLPVPLVIFLSRLLLSVVLLLTMEHMMLLYIDHEKLTAFTQI